MVSPFTILAGCEGGVLMCRLKRDSTDECACFHGDVGVSCKLRAFLKAFIQEEAFRHTWPDHFTSCLKLGTLV